jgi:uncharacterized protein (TIGR03643 family)
VSKIESVSACLLTRPDIDRIIEMAWEDRTPFQAIHHQFGLTNGDVINLMRRELKSSSFRMWRKRTQGRRTKHEKCDQLPVAQAQ